MDKLGLMEFNNSMKINDLNRLLAVVGQTWTVSYKVTLSAKYKAPRKRGFSFRRERACARGGIRSFALASAKPGEPAGRGDAKRHMGQQRPLRQNKKPRNAGLFNLPMQEMIPETQFYLKSGLSLNESSLASVDGYTIYHREFPGNHPTQKCSAFSTRRVHAFDVIGHAT